jgi:exopolysaccharide biosynthesis polyprenyl glycosylphosphotransferase
MFSRQRKARVLFELSDLALIALAFGAAYGTRLLLPLERNFSLDIKDRALVLGVAMVCWILAGRSRQLYTRLDTLSPGALIRETTRQCVYGGAALVLFEYVLRLDLSRPFLLVFCLYTWALLLIYRAGFGKVVPALRRGFLPPHYVLVVGSGERATALARQVESAGVREGVRLRGFLAETRDAKSGQIVLDATYPLWPREQLPSLLHTQVVDEIIFSVGSERLAELEDVFLLCDEEGVRTRLAIDFFPHVNSTISLERLGQTPLLTFSAAPDDEVRLMLKRLLDVVAAGAALVVLAPFMLLVAALVRLTSPGPAVFRQVRCGFNGRRFLCYKFRSMCENAEELRASLEHLNQRGTAFKIPGDPRLTRIGRFLRKYSIDEWPQLWNVLRGEMSLVGPRPAVPDEVEKYKQWQRRRLRMRPGLTCLWALAGRDAVDFETWMRLDMQYIDNWSLGLDWKILLQTVPRVVTGRGAS